MIDYSDKDYLKPSWRYGPLEGAGAVSLREAMIAIHLLAIVLAFCGGYWFAAILDWAGL